MLITTGEQVAAIHHHHDNHHHLAREIEISAASLGSGSGNGGNGSGGRLARARSGASNNGAGAGDGDTRAARSHSAARRVSAVHKVPSIGKTIASEQLRVTVKYASRVSRRCTRCHLVVRISPLNN